MRALALPRQGWKQRDIAAALDASETAVSPKTSVMRGLT